jgi:hypothetical protein
MTLDPLLFATSVTGSFFPDNVTGQHVMTYEYAKLDLLYTISTIYN